MGSILLFSVILKVNRSIKKIDGVSRQSKSPKELNQSSVLLAFHECKSESDSTQEILWWFQLTLLS